MPTINSLRDGYCTHGPTNWADSRDAAGNSVDHNNTRDSNAFSYAYFHMRGTYRLRRAFMVFDTSGVSVKPASATLTVIGYGFGSTDAIVIKSTHTIPTLTAGDFDSFDTEVTDAFGNSDGNGTGTLAGVTTSGRSITYSGQIASWDSNSSSSNVFTLTDAALDDMVDLDDFKICIMSYSHDYLDQDDITGANDITLSGLHWMEMGSGFEPRIDYTVAVTAVDNATFFGANF